MWFNANSGNDRLGSITASGDISAFAITGTPSTSGIARGADNRLWFGIATGRIAAATTAGSTTEYNLPSTSDVVGSLAIGSDKSVWYANAGSNRATYGFGKISTSGTSTHYSVGLSVLNISGGADGNMWFSVAGQSKVGFVTTNGTNATVYSSGITGTPLQIVAGPDGNEYFDEIDASTGQAAVARISVSGAVSEYALPYGFTPSGLTIGSDKNVWVLDSGHDQIGQLVIPAVAHNVWRTLSPMPTARSGACAAVVGTKVYVVGGYGTSGLLRTNEVYDTTRNTWATAAPMPTARWTLACGSVGGLVYAIGGGTASSTSNVIEAYDSSKNAWITGLKAMPTTRNSTAAVSYNGSIYVIGGYNTASGRLASTEAYEPSTNVWTERSALKVGRSGEAIGLLNSTIVTADGISNSGNTEDTEAYSASSNSWTTLKASPATRYNVCSSGIGASLYVAGGSTGSPLATLAIYDGMTGNWTAGASMKTPVTLAAGASVNGQFICFGGSNSDFPGGTYYNVVQSYQP